MCYVSYDSRGHGFERGDILGLGTGRVMKGEIKEKKAGKNVSGRETVEGKRCNK